MRIKILSILSLFFFSPIAVYADKIGLLIVASGEDISLVAPLIESANTHFCIGHDVCYFIFTDREFSIKENVVTFFQKELPYNKLLHGAMYLKHVQELEKMDYLFACDVHMRFNETVGSEILSARTAVLHPEFMGTYGKYETRPLSQALVRHGDGIHYFTGSFYGGATKEFLKMMRAVVADIFTDLDKDIVATSHDESYLNCYLIANPPTKILNPSYCYPEKACLPYKKKIIAFGDL